MPLDERSAEYDRRHARNVRVGLVLSAFLHVLVFLFFGSASIPPSPFSAAGERRGDNRAARGGGLEAVELMAPQQAVPTPPEPVPEPAVEVTEVVPLEPEIELEDAPIIGLARTLAVPGARGPAEAAPGLVDGDGEGDGGTEEEGRFRVIPPRPRGLILPPGDRPDQVRGKEIEVWVFVAASGRVIPDSTRLVPGTGDRRFDRRLRDHASSWVFEAALKEGRAVAEWFRYTIIM